MLPGVARPGRHRRWPLWMVVQAIGRPRLRSLPARESTFSAGARRPRWPRLLWLVVLVLLAVPIASLVTKAGFVVRA